MRSGVFRVVTVVVAWNRAPLLQEALAAIHAQSYPSDAIVVVDNASTDGSAEIVRELWPEVQVARLEQNTGGAGGFAVGLATALVDHHADLVWLMDDDTVPAPTALAELVRAMDRDDVVLAGSKVVWTDGAPHAMNTPRRKFFAGSGERAAAERDGTVPIRSSSFVSMLVRGSHVVKQGLPIADYFIWNDDFEFSTRMLRSGIGVLSPRSVVVHKTAKPGATDADPRDRFYYEVRNKLWLFLRSCGLSPTEKVLYGAATALRWARTFRASKDRKVLRQAFWRGVRDGVRQSPRANAVVLEGLIPAELFTLLDERRQPPPR